jgi:hypothetical protein
MFRRPTQDDRMTDDAGHDPFARRDAAREFARAAMRVGVPNDQAPAPPARAWAKTLLLAAGGAVLLAAASAGLLLHPSPAPKAEGHAASAYDDVTSADEAAILAAPGDRLRVFRLSQAPAVIVLAFASMHEQALTLDRVGAFVEKAGMPRNRVLPDAELLSRIGQTGEDFDSFYYGHDYRAADLARFFATAASDPTPLDPDELALKAFLAKDGMLQPGAVGAVISVPPVSVQPPVDEGARATILRHEISHGVYFTDPAYRAYTTRFWAEAMSEAERAAFRKMLAGEGYDTSNEDLMRNEMQAYLVHTTDRRYFDPTRLGIDAAGLRRRFIEGMPAGWLRDETR